jgi:topoisomerase-4 subunit A
VKSFKAKGKRITTFSVERIEELEPTRFPEPKDDADEPEEEEPLIEDPDHGKSQADLIDEMTGQMKLFD